MTENLDSDGRPKDLEYIAQLLKLLPTVGLREYVLGEIFKRALSKKLNLYWHVESLSFREVFEVSNLKPPTLLPYHLVYQSPRLLKKLKNGAIIGQHGSWSDPLKVLFVSTTPNLTSQTSSYKLYAPRTGQKPTVLKNLVALEFNERNLLMIGWAKSQITGVKEDILSYDGIVVSTKKGLFQFVEEINKKLCIPIAFPDAKSLFVSISAFQEILNELNDLKSRAVMSDKERGNLLNIIGALLAYASEKTRNELFKEGFLAKERATQSLSIPFSSQAGLIEAITNDYPSASGLTKRHLEAVFADARRALGLMAKE